MTRVAPERRNSVRSDVIWSVIGYGVYAICQFGLIAVMTRLASVDDVGRYGFAVSFTTIIIVFLEMGLRISYSTNFNEDQIFSDYLFGRLISNLMSFLIVISSGAYLLLCTDYSISAFLIMIAVLLAKLAESTSDICYAVFQKNFRIDLQAKSLIIRSILSFCLFYVIFTISKSVFYSLLGQAFIWWLVTLSHDLRHGLRIGVFALDFHIRRTFQLLFAAAPLGLAALLTAVNTNVPRVIISLNASFTEAGVYTALSYILVLGAVFSNSIGLVFNSRLALLHQKGEAQKFYGLFYKYLSFMVLVGVVPVVLSSLIGEKLIRIMFGANYAGYSKLFTILCVVLCLRMPLASLQSALLAQRKFGSFAKIRLSAVVFVTVGVFLGLGYFELQGVAISLICSTILELLLFVFVLSNGQLKVYRK